MDPKHNETIDLVIPRQLGFEKLAMDVAAYIARSMGFPFDRIEDVKTSVEEACANAIEHGNKQDVNAKVTIKFLFDGDNLEIDICDKGNRIPRNLQKPDIDEKIAGRQTSRGWGLFLIQKLMDEVDFGWSPEKGNIVRMTVHLKKEK